MEAHRNKSDDDQGPPIEELGDQDDFRFRVSGNRFKYAQKFVTVLRGSKPDNLHLPPLNMPFAMELEEYEAWKNSFRPVLTRTSTADRCDKRSTHSADQSNPHQHALELVLPASRGKKGDPTRIMFGFATNSSRMDYNIDHIQHWLAHSNSSALAIVPPDPAVSLIAEDCRQLSIKLKLLEDNSPFFDRLLRLLPEMKKHASNKHRRIDWYVILDVNTFVPTITRLASQLKAYNPSHHYYLGGYQNLLVICPR